MRAILPQTAAQESLQTLRAMKIPYIPSTEPGAQDFVDALNSTPEMVYKKTEHTGNSASQPQFVGQLLTIEGEQWLFRRMNALKQRAIEQQNSLAEEAHSVAEFQQTLHQIDQARNEIVEANLRLVASLAGKFSHSGAEFDELVSEGNLILLNAVDKFDVGRGFRFSTYATHAIQRHFFRFLQRKQKRKKRETSVNSGVLSETTPEIQKDEPLDCHQVAETLLSRFEDCLDEREVAILRDRFGLNDEESPATLKVVSERVGLSKERVRQLQMRAIEKLQDLAIQLKLRLEPTF
ncbi:sigma-70 family RNA polymerase sigma factor [Thalassoglobus polymorphus]|uniref:RNA polymerase sigma factor SigA n=1 Tax=Thalassoglobus polymorphus TaxID=2527994 RepID=A0A517QUN0_9PLAN|nr:sigma-70 family RNA polymerase sigma factor [Thalassoglobus polymorphus]QDT35323.1 RNA polymerase sigma factor SigA [Thalassoglobus polymorphus]